MNNKAIESKLSPEALTLFSAGLKGLDPEEIENAKILYIKNAISDYTAMKKTMIGFGCLLAFFAIIPIFWPFLGLFIYSYIAGKKNIEEKITNAISIWDIDKEKHGIEFPPVKKKAKL